MAKSKKLCVKKWIAKGELSGKNKTQDTIINECGCLLDYASSYEILGEVLFQATDGKYYTITVEAVIEEAGESYTKDIIKKFKMNKYRVSYYDNKSDEFRSITVEASNESDAEGVARKRVDEANWPESLRLGDVQKLW